MTKKQNIVTLAVGAVIIIALVLIIFFELAPNENSELPAAIDAITNPQEETIATTTEENAFRPRDWEETDVRKAVPVDIKVPEKGDELPADLKDIVAVPELSVTASPGTNMKIRSFVIKAENNLFTPENIIVNIDDLVQITFQAIDKDYDFVLSGYNMKQTAKQGEIKTLSFQANQDGRFIYYCESCGGLDSSASGEVVVVK